MKGLKPSEVKGYTDQELELKERNLRESLQKTKFGKHTGELTNTAQVKTIRKDLARVLTERRARVAR